ncbi:MAG: hypothetical protein N2319_13215 [Candidatus Kapabacteria bacterium]|nr:hypothetical protein [Candidatus Kapabacteria bacterium]
METPLEQILIKRYKSEMIAYIASHPEDFDELVNLAITDKPPYSWRAAWLLFNYLEKNDKRLKRYTQQIIDSLPSLGHSHQRELLKILYIIDIDEDYEGAIFDIALSIWEKINSQPSLRVNAFKIIVKIIKKHPELKHELEYILRKEHLETLSPGIRHSLKLMIKQLKLSSNFNL